MTNIQPFQINPGNCTTVSSIVAACTPKAREHGFFRTAYKLSMYAICAPEPISLRVLTGDDDVTMMALDAGFCEELFIDAITASFADIAHPAKHVKSYVCAKLETDPFRVELPDSLPNTQAYKDLVTAGFYLSKITGNNWYISSRIAVSYTGLSHTQNAKKLANIMANGVFILTKQGTTTNAPEYRYNL